VLPPLVADPDVIGALLAGFVNPYAAGYALDAITCWLILAVWVVHEARARGIRHGWIALLLGLVPGVATGLACYLIVRSMQSDA
jgi:Terpene cyclase DEP1